VVQKKQAQAIVAQMQTDRSQYVQTRGELEKKVKDASLLPLNSEFTQGTLDGTVDVNIGDNLYEKLGGLEIIIKDGVILELRGNK
jgi:hypothetical protein